MNGDNIWEQIYKIILANFFSWLGPSRNKQKIEFWKLIRSIKIITEH